jgi:hypothetical protein
MDSIAEIGQLRGVKRKITINKRRLSGKSLVTALQLPEYGTTAGADI